MPRRYRARSPDQSRAQSVPSNARFRHNVPLFFAVAAARQYSAAALPAAVNRFQPLHARRTE